MAGEQERENEQNQNWFDFERNGWCKEAQSEHWEKWKAIKRKTRFPKQNVSRVNKTWRKEKKTGETVS